MGGGSGISRRDLLGGVFGSTLGAMAGCGTGDNGEDPGSTDSDTVVFTDSTAAESSTDSTTSRPTESTTTATTTTESTPTTTAVERPLVFDGGGTRAFTDALETLRDRGGGTLRIETDTYQFDEITGDYPSGPHARIASLEDVTIEGQGATVEFTNPTMLGLQFSGGRNLTMRNVTFDYRPVPFSQGTITDLSRDRRTVRLELDPEFPPLDHEMFDIPDDITALVHRPDGEFIRGVRKEGRWDAAFSSMTRVEPGVYSLELSADSSWTRLREGRKLTVLARNNRSALYFYKIDGLTVENVTIRAANGAAVGTGLCTDPVFRGCVIAPPPNSNRHIGGDADGIRIINAISSATIEGCRHEKLGDDSLVVQHTLGRITAIEDDQTVSVEETHPFVVGPADTLDVLTPTGVSRGKLPPVASIEYWHEGFHGQRGKPRAITFEEPISETLSAGDFLRNRATGSQQFTVRDNEFRNHRANLIRIAASDGVIENNDLVGCSINPIELETDTSGFFPPKGWVRNVDVKNNHIARAGLNYVTGSSPAGIRCHHNPAPGTPTEGRPNRNITIRNNRITEGASLGIEIHATADVRIENNSLSGLNQLQFGSLTSYGIGIQDSMNTTVTGNEVTGSSDDLSGFGWQRDSSNVTASGNRLVIDGEPTDAGLVEWAPLVLSFDETVSWAERDPGNPDERPLAIFCYEIELLRESTSVKTIDVGGGERETVFEQGVYQKSTANQQTGRWFGGPASKTRLYVPAADLQKADELRVRGLPMDPSITMSLRVDGVTTDAVTFETLEPTSFTLSLD